MRKLSGGIGIKLARSVIIMEFTQFIGFFSAESESYENSSREFVENFIADRMRPLPNNNVQF